MDLVSGNSTEWKDHPPKRSIEVILRIELKESHCENLESVPAVFAKLS